MRVKSVVPPTFFWRFIGNPIQLSPIPIGDPVQLFRDPAELHVVKISVFLGRENGGIRAKDCGNLRIRQMAKSRRCKAPRMVHFISYLLS